ncbi:trypsin beta-like [Condylostylus longicornis]|uniref:trypsin beta-like n=1 Tax=Condylostylus longicornis TaxID=2530218 RepID=UPI00244DA1F2|nr:trypsin beta-like [Condylostylus longicornis]
MIRKLVKIVGGNATDISDVPYQVSVVINGNTLCGGSILSQDWVITAAHCIYNESATSIVVHAGTNIWYSGIPYGVSRVFRHQDYDPNTYINDVALLLLVNSIQYDSNTFPRQPIALAETLPADGTQVLVSGYGDTSENGNLATTLMSVYVNMVNVDSCNTSYAGEVLDGMFCAAAPKKDSCQGDSGGPIVYNNTLIGVVSWGYGCANPQYPGVYTSVPYFYDWITTIYTATNNDLV